MNKIGVAVEYIKTDNFVLAERSKFVDYFTLGILSKFHVLSKSKYYNKAIWFDSDQINTRDLSKVIDETSHSDFFIVGKGLNCSDGWGNFIDKPEILLNFLKANPYDFSQPSITGSFFGVSSGGEACTDPEEILMIP